MIMTRMAMGINRINMVGSDCDDTDYSVHPGATDYWYDGIDQDCDGSFDYDQDGDGEPASGMVAMIAMI